MVAATLQSLQMLPRWLHTIRGYHPGTLSTLHELLSSPGCVCSGTPSCNTFTAAIVVYMGMSLFLGPETP